MPAELQLHRFSNVLGEEHKRLLDSAREQTFTKATVLGAKPEDQKKPEEKSSAEKPKPAEPEPAPAKGPGDFEDGGLEP